MKKPKFHCSSSPVGHSLLAQIASRPGLTLQDQVLTLSRIEKGRVHLLCGGGSGHEPAHAGFVRPGCLSGAVCGQVFASPSVRQVLAGIERVGREGPVLVVVKNYTGDVLNFAAAVRVCRGRGMAVDSLLVADDMAFLGPGSTREDARGLCGTVLIYHLLGLLAT
jgi:dihydroxyacetone kinase